MNLYARQRQQGIAHIGMIIGVVIFIAVVGLIAWRVWDAQKNRSSSSDAAIQQALANVNCEGQDKDICKFYASWKASSSYKVSSINTYGGQTTSSTFESADSGKRYHMVTAVNGKPYETINIDNALYTKAADGTWWKQTITVGKESDYKSDDYSYDFTDPETTEPEQKTTYKLLGKESCGKLTCFKYQVVNTGSTETTEYIWFDDRDYQLRRMRTESKDGNSDQTFSYDKVTINVPSPVKELGPNQMLNPETGEVITLPSQNDIQTQLEVINGAQ